MDTRKSRRSVLGALSGLVAPGLASAAPLDQFAPRRPRFGAADHQTFARLLKTYVGASADGVNRVDYRAWKASAYDLDQLASYLRQLQADDPARLTRAEQFAFWVNLYNAETLRVVLAAYPVASILLVRPRLLSFGPWREKTLRVAASALSLDDIENAILRPLFGDVRVHYALNCASVGCPSLRTTPWRGASLLVDLDVAAADYVNHPRGARMVDGGLKLSSIYKWYRRDFGDSDAALLAHLRAHAVDPLSRRLQATPKIVGYGYDWSLNDAKTAPVASARRDGA